MHIRPGMMMIGLVALSGCDCGGAVSPDDGGTADAAVDSGQPRRDPTIVGTWDTRVDGGVVNGYGSDFAFTSGGSVVVVGKFTIAELGQGVIDAPGDQTDGYAVKLSVPSMNVEWVQTTNTLNEDTWTSVTALPNGDLVMVGNDYAPAPEDGGVGARSFVVRRIDPSGTELWRRDFLVPDGVAGDSITSLGEDVVVAGRFVGTLTVDSVTLVGDTLTKFFALRLRGSDGTAVWGAKDGDPTTNYRIHVTHDGSAQDVILSGMGGSPNRKFYVARLDGSSGEKRWSRYFGSDAFGARAVAGDGSIYAVGEVEGEVSFDHVRLDGIGGRGVALSLDANDGGTRWATLPLNTSDTRVQALSTVFLDGEEVVVCGEEYCAWLDRSTGAVAHVWDLGVLGPNILEAQLSPGGELCLSGWSGWYGPGKPQPIFLCAQR